VEEFGTTVGCRKRLLHCEKQYRHEHVSDSTLNGALHKLDRSSIMEDMAKVVQINTGQPKPAKNPAAVALGRLGGLKGGDARAASMTPERRKEIAQQAAKQRWANREIVGAESTADRAMDSSKATKLA
jgi:hypothetical protein